MIDFDDGNDFDAYMDDLFCGGDGDDHDFVDESDWHTIWVEELGWADVRDPQVPRRLIPWHLLTWFWVWKITGPAYRLWCNLQRPFKHCIVCGKRGVGPYWFCDTCSDECSKIAYARRVAESKKLHLRKDDHTTLCGEWIWQEVKIAVLSPESDSSQFCAFCLKAHSK